MKTAWSMAILAAAIVGTAAAQDTQSLEQRDTIKKILVQAEVLGAKGGFLNSAVKNAPYSAEEITEFNQVLADGTRIHNESHAMVYRDSQGRMRRESPDAITIWDPVANTSYFLDPKQQTVRQMPLAVQVFSTSEGTGRTTVEVRMGALGKEAELPPPPPVPLSGGAIYFKSQRRAEFGASENAKTEALGRRTVEGVATDGSRQVSTIETGAIGNDRPIQIASERWFSQELQIPILTRHNDPRTGEEVQRVVNVNRAEPSADLFQAPAGYQRIEGPEFKRIVKE